MEKPSCMDEILKIDTIDRYNKLFGFETRHPLVGVVRFDTAESQGNYRMTMGFYSVFLKETRGCRINYGKTGYDFDDQTVVSIAPGQTVGYTDIEGIPTKSVGLLFHPDFIRGTSLGRKIRKYTFFSYEANEALHLSEEGADDRARLPEKDRNGAAARHRQAFEGAYRHQYRAAAGLLHAFLRTPVRDARRPEPRCAGPFRTTAGRLPLGGRRREGGTAVGALFRRQDMPFAQLFRRSGRKRRPENRRRSISS